MTEILISVADRGEGNAIGHAGWVGLDNACKSAYGDKWYACRSIKDVVSASHGNAPDQNDQYGVGIFGCLKRASYGGIIHGGEEITWCANDFSYYYD